MDQIPSLPPYPQPLGLFPQFITDRCQSLVLKEKVLSLSGDTFHIKTAAGERVFDVQGKVFSASGRKAFMDLQGNTLFTIRKQHFHIPSVYYGQDANEKKLFEVKGKFSIGSSKAYCTFTSTTSGQEENLFMKGDFFDTHADITCERTGSVVARIDRKFFNASELLGGQQTYAVTIAAGVDMALIAGMCICLDERRNEGS